MISFFPIQKETRLIHISREQFFQNLAKYVKPVSNIISAETSNLYLFNGVWNEEGFSISLRLKIANNFLPLINSEFMQSDDGILINLTYELFPATKKLLVFWTVLTLLITLFFVGLYQAWLYGAISFGLCLVNYILTMENFKIQVRKSKRMLEKLLS